MHQVYRNSHDREMAKNREKLRIVTTDSDMSSSTNVSNIDRQTYTVTESIPDSVWR